ncbi:MAG: nucleotidyltransferase domain-containing protein [Alphaproteobacteria bacterium]|nr:nucleotidyltransferase domain-containing protein [Alphaproteobacteria bacterium]
MIARHQDALTEFRDRVVKDLGERVGRVVLFGSRARGEGRDDSDIDVLVVFRDDDAARDPAVKHKILDIAADVSLRHDVLLSHLRSSARQLAESALPFFATVRREGVTI